MTTVAWDTSNLKVSFNSITGKVCTKCCGSCVCEFTDDCLDCFDEGEMPRYLQVTFSGLRWCSDDSLITELNDTIFCLDIDAGGFTPDTTCGDWLSEVITINGTDWYIWYYRLSFLNWLVIGGYTSGAHRIFISREDTGDGGDCITNNFNNLIEIGDCGGIVFGAGPAEAYGGTAILTNPCA